MAEETKTPEPSLFGMITSPVQQFERIRERPLIWVAMLIVVILTAIGGLLSAMGAEMPDLKGVEGGTAAGVGAIMIVSTVLTSLVALLLGVLVISAIHMIIAKIALSAVSFKQLFSMNTYLGMITALGAVLNGIVAAIIGGGEPGFMFTSLGSLLNEPGELGAIAGLWNSIEVFSIWSSIITAFGLQIVAGFSKKLAWTIVIVIFVIGIIFAMIGSAIPGMAGV